MSAVDENSLQNFSAIRTAYTEKLKKLRDIKPGAPIPSVAPSSGHFMLTFCVALHTDSVATDPKAAIKKSRTFIMRVGSFVSKYVSFRNDVPHYHDLLITHCPHHDAQCQTVPCRIHVCYLPPTSATSKLTDIYLPASNPLKRPVLAQLPTETHVRKT